MCTSLLFRDVAKAGEPGRRVNTMAKYLMHPDTSSSGADASERTLHSLVNALNEGRLPEAVNQFDDHFSFTDHALDLEFTDHARLIEFFRKLREVFPDTALEIESTVACGDHLTAEWKLSGIDIQLESDSSISHHRTRLLDRMYLERENHPVFPVLRQNDIRSAPFDWNVQRTGRVLNSVLDKSCASMRSEVQIRLAEAASQRQQEVSRKPEIRPRVPHST
jgi:hypothetical protein